MVDAKILCTADSVQEMKVANWLLFFAGLDPLVDRIILARAWLSQLRSDPFPYLYSPVAPS